MESPKRNLTSDEEEDEIPESKKPKITISESHNNSKKQIVKLNPADSNLDFDIESNGIRGKGLHNQGFAYCWSGSRANIGIKGGKYMFACKIISKQPVELGSTPRNQKHLCRIGISRGDVDVGNLGESVYSFGYGGSGKFSNSSSFSNYGGKFSVGDTIGCVVDLDSKPVASIGFCKNGKWLGVARYFHAGKHGLGLGGVGCSCKERGWESAVFPHVLLKNVVVEMVFSVEDGLDVKEGYKGWDCALEDGNGVMGPMIGNIKECEVLMMVGLPTSGKTKWVENWVKEHPDKRYISLGTNLILDQMKVPGMMRNNNYGERFDRLMDRATGIFYTLLARASKTPRNFIIDQTNVYKSARKRKLRRFYLHQKIAVVVFSKPDMLKFRAEKRFEGIRKDVPPEAVNEMLANYVLPTSKDMLNSDEQFDEVWFPELSREESQHYLEEMKSVLETSSNSLYLSNNFVVSYASTELQKATIVLKKLNSPAIQASNDHPVPQQVMSSAHTSNASIKSYVSPELQKATIVPEKLNSPAIQASNNHIVPQQVMSSAYPNNASVESYVSPELQKVTTVPEKLKTPAIHASNNHPVPQQVMSSAYPSNASVKSYVSPELQKATTVPQNLYSPAIQPSNNHPVPQQVASSAYLSNASVESYVSPELQKATTVPQNLYSPAIQAYYNHPVPQQVMSAAYPGVGSLGQPHFGGYGQLQYQSISSLNMYGTPIPMGGASYGEVNSLYGRSYLEKPDPYGRHGEAQPYYSTPFHELSSAYGFNHSIPRTEFTIPTSTSLLYNSPGYAPSPMQIPTEPQFAHPSALQYIHSRTPYLQFTQPVPRETVVNLQDPYIYSCGTPYGTPLYPYGNVPSTSEHQSGGVFNHYYQRPH